MTCLSNPRHIRLWEHPPLVTFIYHHPHVSFFFFFAFIILSFDHLFPSLAPSLHSSSYTLHWTCNTLANKRSLINIHNNTTYYHRKYPSSLWLSDIMTHHSSILSTWQGFKPFKTAFISLEPIQRDEYAERLRSQQYRRVVVRGGNYMHHFMYSSGLSQSKHWQN